MLFHNVNKKYIIKKVADGKRRLKINNVAKKAGMVVWEGNEMHDGVLAEVNVGFIESNK